jgi:hypothetical protein
MNAPMSRSAALRTVRAFALQGKVITIDATILAGSAKSIARSCGYAPSSEFGRELVKAYIAAHKARLVK